MFRSLPHRLLAMLRVGQAFQPDGFSAVRLESLTYSPALSKTGFDTTIPRSRFSPAVKDDACDEHGSRRRHRSAESGRAIALRPANYPNRGRGARSPQPTARHRILPRGERTVSMSREA